MSVPITRDGPYVAPYSYRLAAGEKWEALTISAVFDGTGASGSFYPCCSIYTQDGKLVSRDFPSSSVAAGASAEVTYHPFLRQATASTPATSSAPIVATFYRSQSIAPFDAPLSIAAGASTTIPWLHAKLPSDGSITGPFVGNTIIQFNIACMVHMQMFLAWDDGAYNKAGLIGQNSRVVVADDVGGYSAGNVAWGLFSVDGNDWTLADRLDGKIATDEVHGYGMNGDAVAHDVNEAWFLIHAWPTPGYAGGVPSWPI